MQEKYIKELTFEMYRVTIYIVARYILFIA